MPVYRAPHQDYRFLLQELFEVEKQTDLPQCSEISADVVDGTPGDSQSVNEVIWGRDR
jgi:hypothetical protein